MSTAREETGAGDPSNGYRETIGKNPAADLTVRVFAGANHNLEHAETGGVREMFGQAWDTPYAEGYFETMADWLVANGFGSAAMPPEPEPSSPPTPSSP